MGNSLNFNRGLIAMAALVVIFAGIKSAAEIVVPFLLSLFIAIICSPLLRALTNRKVPLGVAIGLLLALIVVIFFSLFGLINNAATEFSQSIPQYKVLLGERLNDLNSLAARFKLPFTLSRDSILENFNPAVIMGYVSRFLLNFSSVISNIFVLILAVIFMLLEAPTMKHRLALVLSSEHADETEVAREEHHIERILQSVIRYLGIKTMVSLLTGIAVYLLLELADVQYAILWATLSFLFNYIPNIGSIIACVPIVLQTLLLNGFGVGLGVAAALVTINMLIGNVLEPKWMGRTLGLSTLVVFLSLLFWGWLLGTVGMLLSVPLTMALKIMLEASPSSKKYAALLGDVEE